MKLAFTWMLRLERGRTARCDRARVAMVPRNDAESDMPKIAYSPILAILLAAAVCHDGHAGEIYRCIGARGAVSYTNVACPSGSETQHVASYAPEADTPPPSAASVAAEAAAASARDAREAAAQAQAAASYQAAQAAYREAGIAAAYAEAQGERRTVEDGGYPAWIAAYPYPVARPSRHAGHHGGHGGPGTNETRLPLPPTLPINTSLFVRHR